MNLKNLLCLVLLIALSACAGPQRDMTRAEYLSASSRTYQKSPDEIFAAAEKVLRLADGSDFHITHGVNAMKANREWSFYAVFSSTVGVDTWNFTTEKTHKGSDLRVAIASSARTGFIGPTGNPADAGTAVNSTAIYDLFFKRLDFILGLNSKWTTCAEQQALIKSGKLWGTLDPLCDNLSKKINPVTGKAE